LLGLETINQDLKQHEAQIKNRMAELQKPLPTPTPDRGR
jgi:hypothetical protein